MFFFFVNPSVLVGEKSSIFGTKIPESDEDEGDSRNEEGAAVFSSSWLPGGDPKYGHQIRSLAHFLLPSGSILILQRYCFYRARPPKDSDKKRKKKRKTEELEGVAMDEDVVEDLVLSSDEDDSLSDTPSDGDDGNGKAAPQNQQKQKQKQSTTASKKKSRANKSRKRKRANS